MKKELLLIHWKKIIIRCILIAMIALLFIFFVPSKIFQIPWDFRNNLWGPAHLLLDQRSPYNIQTLFEASNSVWMPVIIGLFFPIGFLPLQWASNLWILINIICLFSIVILLAKTSPRSWISIPLTVFALAIFPSTVTHFVLGQVTLVVCLVLLILIRYRSQLNPTVIGLLLAISFTKPQLILLFLPTYLVNYFREQGIKKTFIAILSTFIWIGLLCVPLFILFPAWIPDFLDNLSVNNTWFYPTLFSFLTSSLGLRAITIALASIFLAIGIGTSEFLSFKIDPSTALLWCLAITPIFSPIIWSWDFVLMYPMIVFMIYERKSAPSSLVLFCGLGLCTILFIGLRTDRLLGDQFYFWVPLLLNSTLLLSFILRRVNPVKLYSPN